MSVPNARWTASYAAWLVDLDGTLYRPTPVKLVMAAWLALSAPRAVPIIAAFRKEHEELRSAAEGSPGKGQVDPFLVQLERTAERLGTSTGEVRSCVEHWMVEQPSRILRRFRRTALLDEIAAFRTQGGRTALVSDYPARAKLAALGAEGLFEVVIASGEGGGPVRLKPHPDGYQRAADRLGVSRNECLVIGDRLDADGRAAEVAGMGFRQVR